MMIVVIILELDQEEVMVKVQQYVIIIEKILKLDTFVVLMNLIMIL